MPDDSVRNLIRQARSSRPTGHQTTLRAARDHWRTRWPTCARVIHHAGRRFARLSRPDQLEGPLECSGMTNLTSPAAGNGSPNGNKTPEQSGLRLASEV